MDCFCEGFPPLAKGGGGLEESLQPGRLAQINSLEIAASPTIRAIPVHAMRISPQRIMARGTNDKTIPIATHATGIEASDTSRMTTPCRISLRLCVPAIVPPREEGGKENHRGTITGIHSDNGRE